MDIPFDRTKLAARKTAVNLAQAVVFQARSIIAMLDE